MFIEILGYIFQFFECEDIWCGGVVVFMCIDECGCNIYIFKLMFKVNIDDMYKLFGWLVVRDDGVVMSNSVDDILNLLNFECCFGLNGDVVVQYDNKFNMMDGYLEKYRKFYVFCWLQYYIIFERNLCCIDCSGFIVNLFDVIYICYGDKNYWIVQMF